MYIKKSIMPIASVLLVNLVLASIAFGRVFPPTFGWFLAWDDYGQSHTIYKDFFFPFPPVGLFVYGTLPNLFENPLFAEQIIEFVTWQLAAISLYLVSRLLFKPYAAAAGAAFASILYFSRPIRLIAGYFELSWAFAGFGIWLLFLGATRNSRALVFLGGLALSASALTRQTFLIQNLMVLAVFVSYLFIKTHKERFQLLVFSLLGWLLPILCFIVWTIHAGAFTESMNAIFGGGGKEPSIDKLLNWSFGSVLNLGPLWVPLVVITCLIALSRRSVYSQLSIGLPLFALAWLGMLGMIVPDILFQSVKPNTFQLISALVLLIALGLGLARKGSKKVIWSRVHSPVVVFLGTCLFLLIAFAALELNSNENYGALRKSVLLFALVWLASGIAIWISSGWEKLVEVYGFTRSDSKFAFMAIVVYSSTGFLINSLSGGIDPEIMVLLIAIAASSIVSIVGRLNFEKSFQPVLIAYGTLASFVFFVSWILVPYDWWGVKQESIIASPRSTPSIEMLKFVNLANEDVEFYEEYDQAIKSAKTIYPEGKFFFGPNIQGLSILNKGQSIEINCPIIWFDVCPESLAKRDFVSLKESPPEVIVWASPPDYVTSGHEAAFRADKQKSTIREIDAWLKSEQVKENYKSLLRKPLPGNPDQPDGLNIKTESSRTSWILHVYVLEPK